MEEVRYRGMAKITLQEHVLTMGEPIRYMDTQFGVLYKCSNQHGQNYLLIAMNIKPEDTRQALFYQVEAAIVVISHPFLCSPYCHLRRSCCVASFKPNCPLPPPSASASSPNPVTVFFRFHFRFVEGIGAEADGGGRRI